MIICVYAKYIYNVYVCASFEYRVSHVVTIESNVEGSIRFFVTPFFHRTVYVVTVHSVHRRSHIVCRMSWKYAEYTIQRRHMT